jgi:hypothetical protein
MDFSLHLTRSRKRGFSHGMAALMSFGFLLVWGSLNTVGFLFLSGCALWFWASYLGGLALRLWVSRVGWLRSLEMGFSPRMAALGHFGFLLVYGYAPAMTVFSQHLATLNSSGLHSFFGFALTIWVSLAR